MTTETTPTRPPARPVASNAFVVGTQATEEHRTVVEAFVAAKGRQVFVRVRYEGAVLDLYSVVRP